MPDGLALLVFIIYSLPGPLAPDHAFRQEQRKRCSRTVKFPLDYVDELSRLLLAHSLTLLYSSKDCRMRDAGHCSGPGIKRGCSPATYRRKGMTYARCVRADVLLEYGPYSGFALASLGAEFFAFVLTILQYVQHCMPASTKQPY